jgi:hypothetical protein
MTARRSIRSFTQRADLPAVRALAAVRALIAGPRFALAAAATGASARKES